jgi:hypothetical protein
MRIKLPFFPTPLSTKSSLVSQSSNFCAITLGQEGHLVPGLRGSTCPMVIFNFLLFLFLKYEEGSMGGVFFFELLGDEMSLWTFRGWLY